MHDRSTTLTRLLTDRDVASVTGLARSTLAKLRLRAGGPVFIKIGAAVRYREADVRAWLDSQPRKASTSKRSGAAYQRRSARAR